jgi:cyclophilin family peptidyl-prolyl cis-trans isomerase
MQIVRALAEGALAAALGAAALAGAARADCSAPNPEGRSRAELRTVLGPICLDLLDRTGEAPLTVQNFVSYASRGDYAGSFFHRLLAPFVAQGGGYTYDPVKRYRAIRRDPPVPNEPGISNIRGTVAMAKVQGQPDSATSEWFLNLVDNPSLDEQNGGFTVFARVVDADLPVVDAIGALHTEWGPGAVDSRLSNAFTNLPVTSLLERDPEGYGCLIIHPDPDPATGFPTVENSCTSQAEFDAALEETIAAMDPQVPERLVLVSEVALQLVHGEQTPEQQACIVQLLRGTAAVAKAQNADNRQCLARAAAGAEIASCLGLDAAGTVGKAKEKNAAGEAKKCAGLPDPPGPPQFAHTGAAAANDAAVQGSLGAFEAVFGAAPSVAPASDPAGSACQAEVQKRAGKLFDAALAEYVKAARPALAGRGTALGAVSAEVVAASLDRGLAASKKVPKATVALEDGIFAKCGAVDVTERFECGEADGLAELAACARSAVLASACQAMEAAAALDLDCG